MEAVQSQMDNCVIYYMYEAARWRRITLDHTLHGICLTFLPASCMKCCTSSYFSMTKFIYLYKLFSVSLLVLQSTHVYSRSTSLLEITSNCVRTQEPITSKFYQCACVWGGLCVCLCVCVWGGVCVNVWMLGLQNNIIHCHMSYMLLSSFH